VFGVWRVVAGDGISPANEQLVNHLAGGQIDVSQQPTVAVDVANVALEGDVLAEHELTVDGSCFWGEAISAHFWRVNPDVSHAPFIELRDQDSDGVAIGDGDDARLALVVWRWGGEGGREGEGYDREQNGQDSFYPHH
jgi:hypothetical protein